MKRILILGSGFAGLIAAENLSEFTGENYRTTVVCPHRYFTFYPALIRLAFRNIKTKNITFDLVKKLDKLGVRFVEGKAVGIDIKDKKVQVKGNDFDGSIYYDYLIITTGRKIAKDSIPGFFEHSHHLLGVGAAEKFGLAVDNFSQQNIVVGLTPNADLPVPVCETAFALARRFKKEIAKGRVSVYAVFPESIKRAFGGANIHWELEKAFEKHKIKLIANFKVSTVEKKKLVSNENETIPFDLLMLMPPFCGQTILPEGKYTNEIGLIKVDKSMKVKGLEGVYAAGDITALPGPKLAHTAIRQAVVAAENVLHEVNNEEPDDFYYHEIEAIIDEAGADSIYLDYAMWDKQTYVLSRGRRWSFIKRFHNNIWRKRHKSAFLDQGF